MTPPSQAEQLRAADLTVEAAELFDQAVATSRTDRKYWRQLKEPIISRIREAERLAPDNAAVQHFAANMYDVFAHVEPGLKKRARAAHARALKLGFECREPWCDGYT